MLFTILIIVAAVALVAFIVVGVQKAKAEKKGIYADKCPVHHDEELAVGYETAAPAPAPVAKKKTAKKKPAAKKPNSSQKKK